MQLILDLNDFSTLRQKTTQSFYQSTHLPRFKFLIKVRHSFAMNNGCYNLRCHLRLVANLSPFLLQVDAGACTCRWPHINLPNKNIVWDAFPPPVLFGFTGVSLRVANIFSQAAVFLWAAQPSTLQLSWLPSSFTSKRPIVWRKLMFL